MRSADYRIPDPVADRRLSPMPYVLYANQAVARLALNAATIPFPLEEFQLELDGLLAAVSDTQLRPSYAIIVTTSVPRSPPQPVTEVDRTAHLASVPS